MCNRQGWGAQGLSVTSMTARGLKVVALASKLPGLGLEESI